MRLCEYLVIGKFRIHNSVKNVFQVKNIHYRAHACYIIVHSEVDVSCGYTGRYIIHSQVILAQKVYIVRYYRLYLRFFTSTITVCGLLGKHA